MIGTLEAWRAYAEARGDTAPATATDPDALAALTRASDYIVATYPGAIRDPLPEAVEHAAYIAAARELATPGFWARVVEPGDAKVLTEVGASIKWTPLAGGAGMAPRSTLIDAMLAGYSRPARLPGAMVL